MIDSVVKVAVVTALLAVIAALWRRGRICRQRWLDEPIEVRVVDKSEAAPNGVAVVFFTGAFNSGIHHIASLLPYLRSLGDVHVVQYAARRMNTYKTVTAAHDSVKGKYDQVLLVGASKGGLLSLLFALHDRQLTQRHFIDNTYVIACDSPLGADHLPAPVWALRALRFVRPGPVFNLLSRLVTFVMMQQVKEKLLTDPDLNRDHLRDHMQKLRSAKLSMMIDQILFISGQPGFTSEQFEGVYAEYIMCGFAAKNGTDGVVRKTESSNGWRRLFPRLHKQPFVNMVLDSGHVQFVEHPGYWRHSIDAAVKRLRRECGLRG